MENSALSDKVIVYGHATCPQVGPVRLLLRQSQVAFEYVDIHKDPEAAGRVRAINSGMESVPTLVFADGSTLTEPSASKLKAKLESMGYKVGLLAWLIGNSFYIVMGIVIVISVLRFLGVF
ncbi:MAG: glutathione S-transferase N-terminal domain-containing protein [Anaerolineales bacterium]|nr:glutathione S-transferase N-terminal domain-containing protein [Anaerolineales bacterium]